ncbi:GntR family transcriptional regulator [Glycocaulis sp.]|uniref:GntR family transcriptional regulator n=1 Tax=Glycocaulis sp. TaxID=1969725 RepID=UPI003D1E8B46
MDFTPGMVDARLPTPLYHQVYLILRDQIRRGVLASGDVVPGEQELARLMNVSRITVKRALNELASDGLVSRHRGRGTVVSAPGFSPMVKGSFDNLIESLRLMGLETQIELVEHSSASAGEALAEALGLPAGAPVKRIVRLRKLQDEPFSHLTTHLPEAIARKIPAEAFGTEPMLVLLQKAGVEVCEAEQWITATSAPVAVASLLDVPAGSPLLCIERIMRDGEGRAVQQITAYYRSDRFQYHLKSRRKRASSDAAWKQDG